MMPSWSEFGALWSCALIGALALLPYSLRLLRTSAQRKPIPISIPRALALVWLQNAVLSGITVGLGLIAANAVGLGAPFVSAALGHELSLPALWRMAAFAAGSGIVVGAAMLLVDWLAFVPRWPKPLLDLALNTTAWENLTASVYGGVNEEFLMRLFGLSGLAWLFSRIWHMPEGHPTDGVLWLANAIAAVLFALGHLPATKAVVGTLSTVLVGRSFVLNVPIALLCGWLFWRHGIEAAVLAHVSADIVYHVLGTNVLRWTLRS